MAGVHGVNDIVIDGLVLCLDAANSRSIVTNSNTFFDLSKNNKNCVANRSSVYSPLEGGSVSSDGGTYLAGTNSYSGVSLPVSSSERTIICGFKTKSSFGGSYQHIFHYGSQSTNASFGLALYGYNTGGIYYLSNHTWGGTSYLSSIPVQPNTKYIGAVIFKDTESPRNKFFLNGSFGTTSYGQGKTSDYAINTGTAFQYNLYTRIGPSEYFSGNIYFLYVYNRALSDSEVLKTYNALRIRYGI